MRLRRYGWVATSTCARYISSSKIHLNADWNQSIHDLAYQHLGKIAIVGMPLRMELEEMVVKVAPCSNFTSIPNRNEKEPKVIGNIIVQLPVFDGGGGACAVTFDGK